MVQVVAAVTVAGRQTARLVQWVGRRSPARLAAPHVGMAGCMRGVVKRAAAARGQRPRPGLDPRAVGRRRPCLHRAPSVSRRCAPRCRAAAPGTSHRSAGRPPRAGGQGSGGAGDGCVEGSEKGRSQELCAFPSPKRGAQLLGQGPPTWLQTRPLRTLSPYTRHTMPTGMVIAATPRKMNTTFGSFARD